MEGNRRILIIDDREDVHQDIKKVLCHQQTSVALDELTSEILGTSSESGKVQCCHSYLTDSAFQGEDGVRMVEQAMDDGKPYAMAFVDVRIPPGMDGVETVTWLRKVDPNLAVVIITAFSDYNWEQIAAKIDNLDNLFILKKPFDAIEVRQFACALTEKWNMSHRLEKAMAALQEKKILLQTIIDSSPSYIFIKDTENNFLLGNKSFASSLNLSPQELCGKSAFQLFSNELANKYWQDDLEVIRSGSVKKDIIEEGLSAGQVGIFSTSKVPLHNNNGDIVGVIGISTDISTLKNMEKEQIKAKKFETTSVFAGGICHDFNNLLTIIVGYADLALGEVDPSSPVYPMLQEVSKSSLRFKELISSFLSLSCNAVPEKGIFPLEKIIENAVSAAGVNEDRVHCQYFFAENLWQVHMDPYQIGQVFTNVVKNAEEALADGGMIRISVDNVDGRTAARETHAAMKGEKYVRVVVEDNGTGITEKELARIFDPYFSTKRRGKVKGMGLGLTIAYSVIEKHDGHIRVESKLGSGTSVIIYLLAG